MIKVTIEHSSDDGTRIDSSMVLVIMEEHEKCSVMVYDGADPEPHAPVEFPNQHPGNARRLVEDALRHLRKQTLDEAIEP